MGGQWLGKPWIETVTTESRPKVESLLAMPPPMPIPDGVTSTMPRRAAPICRSCIPSSGSGGAGNLVAVGRDLRAMAALQQRLVDAQQSMERDYSRLRHVETRYRLLFQVTSEAVLIVDAASHKVVEANPAAGQLLGEPRQAARRAAHSWTASTLRACRRADAAGRCPGDRPRRQRPGAAGGGPARVAGLRIPVPAGERLAVPGPAPAAERGRQRRGRWPRPSRRCWSWSRTRRTASWSPAPMGGS